MTTITLADPDDEGRERRLHVVKPGEPPAWGSPAPVEVEAGALRDGETDEQPVELREVTVPSLTERVDVPDGERPILPAWLTSRQVARETLRRQGRLAGLAAARAAVQSPRTTGRLIGWTLRGAGLACWAWGRWAVDWDGHPTVGKVVADSDKAYIAMADRRSMRQKFRFSLTGIGLAAVLVGWVCLEHWAGWARTPVCACLVAVLARTGRPRGVKLLAPNPSKAYRPRLTHQGVVAALAALGIGPLTKALAADATRIWRSDFTTVRGGHKIELQLPASVLSAELVQHEQRIASALARPADTVVVEPLLNRTPSDLRLWIFDKPVLAGDIGPGPLAKARKTTWFDPVTIGLTRTGEPFRLDLRGGAWFVGGQPGSGKSTMAQIAAAHTALDPRALLVVSNLKGSPDWAWARPIAHRYIAGSPETDRTVIPATVDLLAWLLDETARRNDYLVRLVEKGRAESTDVTPELAKAHDELRPMTVILDEVHRLFDAADNDRRDEAVEALAKVIKACRSVAITIIGITQLAGTESIPPALTRAARVRGCLKVQDEVSWRQIFGNAGKGSFDGPGMSALAKGTVILRSEDGAPTKVGCHYLRPGQLAEIGRRVLATRTDLELLTGEAAGQATPDTPLSDPGQLLRDVLSAIPAAAPTGGPQDAGAAWLTGLEEALSEDEAYADRADGWLSGELTARGVKPEKVSRRWVDDDGTPRQKGVLGVRSEVVRAALIRLTPGG